MTIFLSRSAWGAQPPNRHSADRAATTHVFVHHSATLNPTQTPRPDDIEESKEQWRAFQADHLGRTLTLPDGTVINWADLAYSIGAGPGVILEGRGWDVKGGGTGPGQRVQHPSGSWDNVSVSICVIGNYQSEQLDPLTRTTLVAALTEARARYGDNLIIMGDRDVNYTSCCGDHLYALLPELWAESGDDMPSAQEIADAHWNTKTSVFAYDEGKDIECTMKELESWRHQELQQIRRALTGPPAPDEPAGTP